MKTAYNVGIYCRLSREDLKNGKRDTSLSIENQQTMLENYANERGWRIFNVYLDDDVTGTTFQRPGFQALMNDAMNGLINCVITKDLSRLGRNYIEAGRHREIFNENGIRYIAIHDNHDSSNDDYNNISTPIKEIMNEMYAADVSRKVRSTKKMMAEQGKFSNSRAPYGYAKSKECKHVLVIDEAVSHNIVRIFEMFLSGKPARAIADTFNKEEIMTANEYHYSTLGKPSPFRNNKNKWGSATIMNIIKNPVYYGAMANGKRAVKSFKNKNFVRKSMDEWIIVEDTHEPIISKEVWEEAQKLGTVNRKETVRRNSNGEVSLFAGLIRCADCGGNMALKTRENKKIDVRKYYRCSTYVQKGKDVCKAHEIDFDVLSQIVLSDLKRYAVLAVADEKKLIDQILQANEAFQNKNLVRYEKTIRESKNRINEIDGLLQNLYEDKISGEVTPDLFKRMTQKYGGEQSKLIADVEQLESELAECQIVKKDMTGIIQRVKECLCIETLTRSLVVELVEKVEVSEIYTTGGEPNLDIAISYKFGRVPEQEKRAC